MTLKDYSTIQRMLGVIEGCAADLEDKRAALITEAVTVIDETLDEEMEGEAK